jgi:hypothetical protein
MELHTLFRRESAAEPFFIRIKYILPSSVPIIINVVSSVPVQGAKSGELESRFIRNCRLKNGSVLKEKICLREIRENTPFFIVSSSSP